MNGSGDTIVVSRTLGQIKPYAGNLRNIPKSAVEAVKKSIEKYGYNVPILIDHNNVIVAGHTRYKALKELKVSAVTCVQVNETDELTLNKMRLLDNHIGEASDWDMSKLNIELRSIYLASEPTEFKEFAGLFPDGDEIEKILKRGLAGSTDVTKEQVSKKMAELEHRFDGKRETPKVRICCPNCLKQFDVKESE